MWIWIELPPWEATITRQWQFYILLPNLTLTSSWQIIHENPLRLPDVILLVRLYSVQLFKYTRYMVLVNFQTFVGCYHRIDIFTCVFFSRQVSLFELVPLQRWSENTWQLFSHRSYSNWTNSMLPSFFKAKLEYSKWYSISIQWMMMIQWIFGMEFMLWMFIFGKLTK